MTEDELIDAIALAISGSGVTSKASIRKAMDVLDIVRPAILEEAERAARVHSVRAAKSIRSLAKQEQIND